MHGLKSTAPQVWDAFKKGGFVVQKSDIPFTAIGVDHAGEQVNKILKINGGSVGISHILTLGTVSFLPLHTLLRLQKK